MPAERCRVGKMFDGVPQPHYYQRDTEEKRNGRWVAIPFFNDNPKLAAPMSEAVARQFITKLQGLGLKNLWIEDCRDGRRIEIENPTQPQSGVDNRPPWATATLDDGNSPDASWYLIRPTNTPYGPKWFLRIDIPGHPEPQVIYEDEPLAVLRRAVDMGILKYAIKHELPKPQPAAPVQNTSGWRRRPGDKFNA